MSKEILDTFRRVASDPMGSVKAWKQASGQKVVGSFPMNFPGELVHAAGALPVLLQEADDPITVGHGVIYPFYCGYTRSVVDQATKGDFEILDAIMFGDHCVQLLGAADAVRIKAPQKPVVFYQLISSMNDPWTHGRARESFVGLKAELEEQFGQIDDKALHASIRLFNRNRKLIRRLYDLRRTGRISISARDMQAIVKSSMVMDKATHTAQLESLVSALEAAGPVPDRRHVRVHLSGHFCQAPKPEILDLIESCGATVVGDDLFHGFRYISTDVHEEGDPLDALAHWYMARNTGVPCPTRVQNDVDWDGFLLKAVSEEKAQGMVVLMAKFCEPHMYYYPEVKHAFERHGIPHLLVETEHEGIPMEGLKTRLETFLEIVRRREAAMA